MISAAMSMSRIAIQVAADVRERTRFLATSARMHDEGGEAQQVLGLRRGLRVR